MDNERTYGCRAYSADEVSNGDWNDGDLFNLEGRVLIYRDSIMSVSFLSDANAGNPKPLKFRDHKDKVFFRGIWYRGGKVCEQCCKKEINGCKLHRDFFLNEETIPLEDIKENANE